MKRASLLLISVLLIGGLVALLLTRQHHARLDASLVRAVNRHDAPGVEALLTQGADPNARDWKTYAPGGRIPFRPPWYEKPLAALRRRKPRPADPYAGPTVLMIAADHGDTAIAQSLLGHGADVTKTGNTVETEDRDWLMPLHTVAPLWEAVKEDHADTVAVLLKYGAPVDGRGWGLTPLHLTGDLKIATALLDAGADVNAGSDEPESDAVGETQLHRAVRGSVPEVDGVPNLPLASLLIQRGAKIEAKDYYGKTPLMAASEKGSIEGVNLLLHWGAHVNARDNSGRTALMIAAEQRHTEALRFLLAHGASVNAQDNLGQDALMLASDLEYVDNDSDWQGQRQARLRLLRQHGANASLKDKRGKTAAAYVIP